MNTTIFPLISASTDATDLLGTAPVRFYEFGSATEQTALPYATWQVVSGTPDNLLGEAAENDYVTIQIDIWATRPESTRDTARAVRRAIENDAYITALRGETKDSETGLYRATFNASLIYTN
ncbi:tail completion protein gp17 [Denitromonas halophila]|uniref:DUF3168 domain-containing protein n=1 Tax=Denitromonas halophila TaxID=1629404 RepID=A0A557QJT1_9RHOO|nr:DUF3168 domain-containing protein [Denitromonas halophila]TVO53161.1 DUF3168 domain-containing protein [Denitromonas halophila]